LNRLSLDSLFYRREYMSDLTTKYLDYEKNI